MNARSARAVTNYRVVTIALAVLAVGGWGAFAYVSWSAARTERALQSQITRLNTDRNGAAAARNQQGQESAATRTVYPAPYGTSAPRPAQVVSSAAPLKAAPTASGQPSVPVEATTAEQGAAARAPSAVSAPPQPSASAAQPIITELVTRDAQDAKRMDSNTPEAIDPKLVDINTASVEELNSLGGRFGRAIIASRPYATTDELLSKRVLTRSTFSQIKDQITAN
jgi:DNA uptake protein ComE-like DNA-binding protein